MDEGGAVTDPGKDWTRVSQKRSHDPEAVSQNFDNELKNHTRGGSVPLHPPLNPPMRCESLRFSCYLCFRSCVRVQRRVTTIRTAPRVRDTKRQNQTSERLALCRNEHLQRRGKTS